MSTSSHGIRKVFPQFERPVKSVFLRLHFGQLTTEMSIRIGSLPIKFACHCREILPPYHSQKQIDYGRPKDYSVDGLQL